MTKPTFRPLIKAMIFSLGYMSVREFAVKNGIHETTLSSIIRGRLFPGDNLRAKLAECLQMPLVELEKII